MIYESVCEQTNGGYVVKTRDESGSIVGVITYTTIGLSGKACKSGILTAGLSELIKMVGEDAQCVCADNVYGK